MTLRRKAILTMFLGFLPVMGILLYISQSVISDIFVELEERETRLSVQRVLNAMSNEVSDLGGVAKDWSSWDEAYDFVADRDPEFVKANFADSTFISLEINFILIYDTDGKLVAGRSFDLESRQETALARGIEAHLTPGKLLLRPSDPVEDLKGIILLPDYPVVVTSGPVLRSGHGGPARGTFLMGRYLQSPQIEHLSDLTQTAVSVAGYNAPGIAPDFLKARKQISESDTVAISALDNDVAAGYTTIKDIYGQPALMLKVEIPREIYRQGEDIKRIFLLVRFVNGIILVIAVLILMDRWVLSRLSRLNRDVARIGTKGDSSGRVSIHGRDEISHLASGINGMLDALERSRQDVRESEQKLQALYEQERQVRRDLEREISNRSQYTRALVHELKTPLTAMVASSELLQSEAREEPLASLADVVHRGALSLDRRIDDLMDLARGEMGLLQLKPALMDPGLMLKNILGEMSPAASAKGITLALQLDPALPMILGDEDRLRQVVLNFVSNALKFTSEGGTITLRGHPDSGGAAIQVEDTGKGMEADDVKHVFESYHRLKKERDPLSGLGIGLSLARMLVQLHNGRIWATSQSGKGSTFGFWMPQAPPPPVG